MPYAVTHLLVALILVALYRDYFVKNKKHFPLHYVLLGGIAGLLPDADIGWYYLFSFFGYSYDSIHRTFTHTLFFPGIFLLAGILVGRFNNRKLAIHHLKLRNMFFVIAFGVLIHLLLDMVVSGSIMPFYPLITFSYGMNLFNYLPQAWQDTFMQSFDAAILILWLIYLEVKHKISDVI